MRTRTLGRTEVPASALTFGCGNVGGLMVRGRADEQREAVAMALDAGIRYFDTAPIYGNGISEETLGRVLPPSERRAAVGTKVRLPRETAAIGRATADAIRQALDASLKRLGRDSVDLYQLHNAVDDAGAGHGLPVDRILNDLLPVFQDVRREGKVRHIGFTALGDPSSVERLVAAGGFEVAQVPYNLLDPSAALESERAGSARLLGAKRPAGLGTIGIRVLAGGALGGAGIRHPLASPTVASIGRGRGTADDYAGDLLAAARFQGLVDAGAARSLPALAIRYGLSLDALDTVAVGFSSLEQLREALDAVAAGPLDPSVLDEIRMIQTAEAHV